MKTLLLCVALSLCIPAAFSSSVKTDNALTVPKQVTVYPNGARVTREGTLELSEGVHSVVFADLPASVVEPSVRLSVEGPKGTRFYGVNLKKEFTPHVVDARTRKLKDEIQKLQDQKTDLADKIEARRSEINMLRTYGTTTYHRKGEKTVNVTEFEQSASSISKRIAELMAEDRKDERHMRDLDARISALNGELSQGGAAARERRTAQADLELPQAGTVRFKLSYQVSGASWAPVYDLNLETSGDKPILQLGFNASIRQNTGEDWKGVILTLSTSRPTESTQVPDPTNWWLNYYTFQTQLYRRSHDVALPAAPSASTARDHEVAKRLSEGKADELEPAEIEMAKNVQAAYAANYVIKVEKDVPSDGSEHRVGVLQAPYSAELELINVPRLSPAVFLQAKISYDGEQILLPGPAQLSRDGEFVGSASLAAKAPGEDFELGFGQDDLVRVERKKEDEKTDKGERRYRWSTVVSNFHPDARTIEVREQLPRSQQKDIKVDPLEISPDPLPEDPDKAGLVRWKLALKPKEKAKLVFSYRVRFPADANLSGLE